MVEVYGSPELAVDIWLFDAPHPVEWGSVSLLQTSAQRRVAPSLCCGFALGMAPSKEGLSMTLHLRKESFKNELILSLQGLVKTRFVVGDLYMWSEYPGMLDISIETLIACGGLSKNEVFIQEHADVTGCKVVLPREKETVLLGAAILGAVASRQFESVQHAMKVLNAPGLVVEPSMDEQVRKYHDAKYNIFHSLYKEQVTFRYTMATVFS